MKRRLPILAALLVLTSPLLGKDASAADQGFERRINRLLCRVGEFFTRPVRLPKGYYLKESYGVVSLHDRQGKVLLDENAAHFYVKEPYVAIWGDKKVFLLNTETGEITSVPEQYHMPLPQGGGSICIKDFLTFWDITTGYKPITWSQK